jgi:hypothetical protein
MTIFVSCLREEGNNIPFADNPGRVGKNDFVVVEACHSDVSFAESRHNFQKTQQFGHKLYFENISPGNKDRKASVHRKQNSKRIVQAVLVVAYYHKAFAPGRDIVLVYNMVTSVVDVIVNKLYVAVQ